MSKPLKVAFATEDLQQVDAHFGWARNIAIYDITADSSTLATVVRFEGDLKEDGTEDKLGPSWKPSRTAPSCTWPPLAARRRPGW